MTLSHPSTATSAVPARPAPTRPSRLHHSISMRVPLPAPIRPVSFAEMELDPEAATTPMTPSEDLTPTPRSCFMDLESEPDARSSCDTRRGNDYFALLESPCSPRTRTTARSVPTTAPLLGANAMLGPSGMMELEFQRRRSSSASDCSTCTVKAAGETEDDFKAGLKLGWDIHPSHLGLSASDAEGLVERTNRLAAWNGQGASAAPAPMGKGMGMARQRSEQARPDSASTRRRLVPSGMVRQASHNSSSSSTGMSRTVSSTSNPSKRARAEYEAADVLSPPSPMGPFTPPQILPFAMPAMSSKTPAATSPLSSFSSMLARSAPAPTSPIDFRHLRAPYTATKGSPTRPRMARSATFSGSSAGTDMVRCISVPVATQAEFDAASLEHSLSRFTIDSGRSSVREEIKAGVLTAADDSAAGTPKLSSSADDRELSTFGGRGGWKTHVNVPYPYNILGAAGEAIMSSPQSPEQSTRRPIRPVAGLGIVGGDILSSPPPPPGADSPPTPSKRAAFARPGLSRALTFDASVISAAARRVEA